MTVKMTAEFREALAASGQEPLRVVDSQSNKEYVLVPAEAYEEILEAQLAALRETYPAQEAVARAQGWDDPIMDEYDHYDEVRGRSNK